MRILYFINGFDPGGAEHGLLTLVRNGFFAGHTLRIVGMCHGRGDLAETLRAEAGPDHVSIYDDRDYPTLKTLLLSAPALVRDIRSFRPDVVVLSLKQANLVGRIVLRFFPAVRCISFEHTSRYRAQRAAGFYPRILKALSGRVDEVWADCRETLNATRTFFRPRSRRETAVPLFCVDEGRAFKADYRLAGPLRVAAAGRFIDVKNFDRLVRAVSQLNEEGTDTQLTIFGDGPERMPLTELVRSLGMENKISLPGYRARWYDDAAEHDIFVNASDTEGFCIVVAEAMSVGLPVVATNVGGIREYGRHEENIWKIGDEGEGRIITALKHLAGDEVSRKRLGEAARADMAAHYSPKAIAERGAEIFGGLKGGAAN